MLVRVNGINIHQKLSLVVFEHLEHGDGGDDGVLDLENIYLTEGILK